MLMPLVVNPLVIVWNICPTGNCRAAGSWKFRGLTQFGSSRSFALGDHPVSLARQAMARRVIDYKPLLPPLDHRGTYGMREGLRRFSIDLAAIVVVVLGKIHISADRAGHGGTHRPAVREKRTGRLRHIPGLESHVLNGVNPRLRRSRASYLGDPERG